MKVDFTGEVLDLKGKKILVRMSLADLAGAMQQTGIPGGVIDQFMPQLAKFVDEAKAQSEPQTYANYITGALTGGGDKDASWAEMIDRGELAERILEATGPIEIDNKDQARIETCVKMRIPLELFALRTNQLFKNAAAAEVEGKKPGKADIRK